MKKKNIFKSILQSGLMTACIMAFVCALFSGQAMAETTKAVKIKTFKATPTEIAYGEATELTWEVENAFEVELAGVEKGEEEVVPLSGSYKISLTKTTQFTLIAKDELGNKVTKSVTVKVGDQPKKEVKINVFEVSATHVPLGGEVEIKWEVENAKSVELLGWEKGNEEMLPLSGSMKVKINQKTNFVLVAKGLSGKELMESRLVTIDDDEAPTNKPRIISFTASKERVKKYEMISLKWETENAKSCRIITNDGFESIDRPVNGEVYITPNRTMTYTLIAINGTDRDEESIKIYVE